EPGVPAGLRKDGGPAGHGGNGHGARLSLPSSMPRGNPPRGRGIGRVRRVCCGEPAAASPDCAIVILSSREPGKTGLNMAAGSVCLRASNNLAYQQVHHISGEDPTMADHETPHDSIEDFWRRGKVTRRRLVGYTAASAGALGATILVPAPWRAAFGQAKPYKIGTLQPLSGAGAAGGKTALVGVQMAVDRINKSGGVNGRPIELIVADDESKPDVGRRKVEKLLVEDNVDVHVGGFLSNICLACMPVFEEYKVVNIISVCLDTTLTTTKCNRYSFRP